MAYTGTPGTISTLPSVRAFQTVRIVVTRNAAMSLSGVSDRDVVCSGQFGPEYINVMPGEGICGQASAGSTAQRDGNSIERQRHQPGRSMTRDVNLRSSAFQDRLSRS